MKISPALENGKNKYFLIIFPKKYQDKPSSAQCLDWEEAIQAMASVSNIISGIFILTL